MCLVYCNQKKTKGGRMFERVKLTEEVEEVCMKELIELYKAKVLINQQLYRYMDEEEIGRYEELIRLYMVRMKKKLGRGNENDN